MGGNGQAQLQASTVSAWDAEALAMPQQDFADASARHFS